MLPSSRVALVSELAHSAELLQSSIMTNILIGAKPMPLCS